MKLKSRTVNPDVNATRRFRSAEAQTEIRTMIDVTTLIAGPVAAARFKDQIDTDPKVCAQIAIAAGIIAGAIIALAKKHIEVGITHEQ